MITKKSVETMVGQIARQLRYDLLSGRYEPGKRLPEVRLAAQLGVGRGQVREALKQLSHEGLVVAKPNCGVTVAPRPSKEANDLLWPMRAQIETYALAQYFDELNEHDFQEWEKIIARLRLACEEQDHAAVLNYDFDFHCSLLTRAGLEEVIPVWKLLVGLSRPYHAECHKSFHDIGKVHALHAALVKTFRGGDKHASIQALREHLMNGEFNKSASCAKM